MSESVRHFYVLHYVNGDQFVGRFAGHWTRSRDVDAALLFTVKSEAENALCALLQEAADRCAKSKESWPRKMWWDFFGGLVVVAKVEQITRVTLND